jgi:hypothetical protein
MSSVAVPMSSAVGSSRVAPSGGSVMVSLGFSASLGAGMAKVTETEAVPRLSATSSA